jgi:hypothetical protein
MTTESIARCAIYETRPEVCRVYPKPDHYRPAECTYSFIGGERVGSCDCKVGACCAIPRQGGEPGGAPLPEISGGSPCKHLVHSSEKEKVAWSSEELGQNDNVIDVGLGLKE